MDMKEMVESLGITPEQAQELLETAKQNPMAAMGMLGAMGITPDKLQVLMQMVMQNSDMIKNMASQFGVSEDMIDKVKDQFDKK